MGRPLSKKYMGNRNIGTTGSADNGIGGEGVASVTLALNNSTGYTTGSAVTFSAPTIPTGVTATGTITTFASAGAMTDKTTFTRSGTSVAATGTYTGVVQKAGGTTSGTGAVFTITKSTSATTYTAVTITVTSPGSGYALADTIVIDGSLLGGVTSTNDLTLTVATFVGTTGTISGFVITNKGSGYATAPTISAIASPGTVGTTTYTPVLTVDTGAVGSATNQENAILAYAFIGGSLRLVDLVKQISTKRYKVRYNGTNYTARIRYDAIADGAAGYTAAEGIEMNMVATDSAGGTYLVRKLYNRTCTLAPLGINNATIGITNNTAGTAITAGQQTKWSFATAATGVVQIQNA